MNFDPTDEQRSWRDLARDFAQGEIRPRAAELDREQKFPYDIVAEMARLGLMGLTLPEEYGGSGGDFVAYNLALEEISRADTSVGITMEAHISLGCAPIAAYGTQEQKEKFLSRCATGENLWAFGLTEEEAGTDAGGTQHDGGARWRRMGRQRVEEMDHELRNRHHRRRHDHRQDRNPRERSTRAHRDPHLPGHSGIHPWTILREAGLARL